MPHKEQLQPHEIIGVVIDEIDLYWDHLLEPPQNTLQITSRDPDEETGQVKGHLFTIQRIYDTAYYLKCVQTQLESLGGKSPVFAQPLGITEFRFLPALFETGKINVTHTDAATNLTVQGDYLMDQLAQENPAALKILQDLQLNLLALLIGYCKTRPLFVFDPFPQQVHQLALDIYGPIDGEDLWRTGMEA